MSQSKQHGKPFLSLDSKGRWLVKGKRVGPHEQIVLDAACLLPCTNSCVPYYFGHAMMSLGLTPEFECISKRLAASVRRDWEWVEGS